MKTKKYLRLKNKNPIKNNHVYQKKKGGEGNNNAEYNAIQIRQIKEQLERIGFEEDTPRFNALLERLQQNFRDFIENGHHQNDLDEQESYFSQTIDQLKTFKSSKKKPFIMSIRMRDVYNEDDDDDYDDDSDDENNGPHRGGEQRQPNQFSDEQILEIKNQLKRIGFEENGSRVNINTIINFLNRDYINYINDEEIQDDDIESREQYFTSLIEHMRRFRSSKKEDLENWARIGQQGGYQDRKRKTRKRKTRKKY
jgi:hypothetical protein